MNRHWVGVLLTFFLRHFIASIVSIAAAALLVILAFIVLFVVAILGDYGLGSPVAPLFWTTAMGMISLFYTACLLFPAVFIAELVSHKLHTHQLLAQVLSSTAALAGVVILLTFVVRQIIQDPASPLFQLADHPVPIFLGLCIPLGLYFWVAKMAQAATTGITALCKRLFGKRAVHLIGGQAKTMYNN